MSAPVSLGRWQTPSGNLVEVFLHRAPSDAVDLRNLPAGRTRVGSISATWVDPTVTQADWDFLTNTIAYEMGVAMSRYLEIPVTHTIVNIRGRGDEE